MTKVQRFTWEDALIQAQVDGVIPNGALLVALKLSKAINWSPKDKRPPGLYWKNDDALEAVGCGRATYFKHRDVLFEAGFFQLDKGNLLPIIPEKSTVETTGVYSVDSTSPQYGLSKSTGHNPLSVDTFSGDSLSVEDVVTDSAGAPSVELPDRTGDHPLSLQDDQTSLYPAEDEGRVSKSEEESRESTVWTEEEYEAMARTDPRLSYHFDKYKRSGLGGSLVSNKKAYQSAVRHLEKERTNTKG